ncbi:MAG: tetratricopeptide repeat protein [Proteobacteria bacterium]|nr:tetratricopeptide repeat protein [Pseudomonadota bacterium]
MRKFSFILALLAGAMLPLTAVAQDSAKSSSSKKKSKNSSSASSDAGSASQSASDGLDMKPDQVMLNDQAAVATRNGDYAKAEQLFQAMQAIQELDLVYMNLGRTYAKEGKCLEAAEAYSKVATAPHYTGFDRTMIRDTTAKFVAELGELCSAKIVMNCNPSDMSVSIDGGKDMPCSSKPLSLTPGRHSFYGKTSYGFNTVVVEGVASQTVEAKIEVIDYESIAAEAGVSPEVIRKKSTLFKALGWTFFGLGVAVGGTGGFFMGYYSNEYNNEKAKANLDRTYTVDKEKYDELVLIGNILLPVGGAIAATGIILLIVDAVKIQPQLKMIEAKTSSFHIDPVLSPSFNGMVMNFEF